MSKFQIRSTILITGALALAPAVALAADVDHGPSTKTTTAPPPNPSTTPPQGNTNLDRDSSGVLSPSTPPDLRESDTLRTNPNTNLTGAIDPAQVQKVFGTDTALIDLKSLSKEQIRQLQQRLQERGFYKGKVDGAMGPQTRNALTGLMAQQYALTQRLVNNGQITQQFANSIGVEMTGRMPVSGTDPSSQIDRRNEPSQQPAPTYPDSNQNAPAPKPAPPNQ